MLAQWLNRSKEMGLSYSYMVFIIMMSLLSTLSEIFGLGIFIPIFQYIKTKGDLGALVGESKVWEYIISTFGVFNVEVSLPALLLISFSFFLGRQIFSYIRVVFNAEITYKLVKKLRDKIFTDYLNSDTSFHDKTPVGNISNTITVESGSAIISLTQPLELITYLIMASGYLSILFFLSWQMTSASVFVLLFASIVPNIWIKKSAQAGRDLTKSNTTLATFLISRLKSPRLVRLAGTQIAENNEFNKLTQKQRGNSVRAAILLARTDVVIEPVIIGLSLVFLYVSYTYFNLNIEIIGVYLVIALRMMPVSKSIISQWQHIQNLLGPIEMVENRLSSMKASKEGDSGILKLNQIKQSIQFLGVSYHYPGANTNALTDVTIKIPVNSMTALVGPSGSGKSTLIDLFPILRVPTSGVVQIDSILISDYTLKSLRKAIAYSPQSPQIFDGTVKDHIRYGKSDATNEEVIEAAKLAGVDTFIDRLPDGYDTFLGEDAVRLSGGQKQRLDLARTLVSEPQIMIFDEPTSNLDVDSEEMFRKTIERIRRKTNTTIIIVAHRLSSIFDSDQIIVLNQGRVESTGKHIDLIQQGGWYERAWAIQDRET